MQNRLLDAAEVLAAAVWLGGLVALGAVVAPIVFHEVPAPWAADAMARVFTTFDKIALASAAIVCLCEALRFRAGATRGKLAMLRMGSAVCAAALVLVEALFLAPKIVALHAAGAVRGLGEAGLALEHTHRLAELCAKAELVFLLAFVILLAVDRRAPSMETSATTERVSPP